MRTHQLGSLLIATFAVWGLDCSSDTTGRGSGGAAAKSAGGSSGTAGTGQTGGAAGTAGTGLGGSGGGAVGTGGRGGAVGTGGSGGAVGNGGAAGTGASGGAVGTGGSAGGGAGGSAGGGTGGTGGVAGTGGTGAAGTNGASGTGGTGGFTPPTGANSIAYIGCSMAWNIGNGYKRVGGTRMWNSDSYQTSAMVVQNWTNENSSSWQLFDRKMNSIGGRDTVKAIMVQICIRSSRATDAELRSMVASARKHVNPGTHIYIVGQPVYQAGHECSIAGNGGAKWTDDQAKLLAADPSVNQDMSYLGQFKLDSTKSEVSPDSCHATQTGEDVLGRQAMAFFGG
jgi:hypothetical protein